MSDLQKKTVDDGAFHSPCLARIGKSTHDAQFCVLVHTSSRVYVCVKVAVTITEQQCFSTEHIYPTINVGPGTCLWKGQCVKNNATGGLFNCFYNGPAVRAQDDADLNNLLGKYCPEYANKTVCCDSSQLTTLHNSLSYLESVIGKCKACIHNFMTHFCGLTCDPDMSQFAVPEVYECYTNDTRYPYVQSMEVYVSASYAQLLFDSCKDVKYFGSYKAIDLICGRSNCNATYLLQYMSDPRLNGNRAPFLESIRYTTPPENMKAMEFDTYSCYDKTSGYACACEDCPKACPTSQ